jgi:hypothetical protein
LDEIIPKAKITVKITDMPKNAFILTSTLRNYDFDEIIDTPIILPSVIMGKNWLKKRTDNDLYCITEKDYDNLDPFWRERYSYRDTAKNNFTVEYLFNEILSHDDNNMIILPEMKSSFKKLAVVTSTVTNY